MVMPGILKTCLELVYSNNTHEKQYTLIKKSGGGLIQLISESLVYNQVRVTYPCISTIYPSLAPRYHLQGVRA